MLRGIVPQCKAFALHPTDNQLNYIYQWGWSRIRKPETKQVLSRLFFRPGDMADVRAT
jgi:hypothetical protein